MRATSPGCRDIANTLVRHPMSFGMWRYRLDNDSEDAQYRVDGSRVRLKHTSLLSSSVFCIGSWSLSMCFYSISKGGTQQLALRRSQAIFFSLPFALSFILYLGAGVNRTCGTRWLVLGTRFVFVFVFAHARDAIDSALPSPDCIQIRIRTHQPQMQPHADSDGSL